jgi:hypothetical protein
VPSLRAAKRLAEELEPLTNWEAVTTADALEGRCPDRATLFRVYTCAMRKAGYHVKPKFGVIDWGEP